MAWRLLFWTGMEFQCVLKPCSFLARFVRTLLCVTISILPCLIFLKFHHFSNISPGAWSRPNQPWLILGARCSCRRNSQGRRRATSLRIELRECMHLVLHIRPLPIMVYVHGAAMYEKKQGLRHIYICAISYVMHGIMICTSHVQ